MSYWCTLADGEYKGLMYQVRFLPLARKDFSEKPDLIVPMEQKLDACSDLLL